MTTPGGFGQGQIFGWDCRLERPEGAADSAGAEGTPEPAAAEGAPERVGRCVAIVRVGPTLPVVLATEKQPADSAAERVLGPVAATAAPGSIESTAASREAASGRPLLGARRSRAWALYVAAAAAALAATLALALGRTPPPAAIAQRQGLALRPLETGAARDAQRSATHEFRAQGALEVAGRLSHRAVPTGERTEAHVLLELRGSDEAAVDRAPVHLALVIDRSGSMSGARLLHAKAAARGAVERLRHGDMVSVTAFDTHVLPLVAPTVIGETSRARVLETIDRLATGSDTCISCGIEAALAALGASPDLVGRVLLLSDGEANVAVRDVAGFSRIGRDAQGRNVSISTIGVGIDYNERLLSALSRESNGRHHYARDEASLASIFDAETEALGRVVAVRAEARIELGPEVELIEVLDRAHRVEGSTVVAPLGQLSRGEQKTVLLKVALDAALEGALPVCHAAIAFSTPLAGRESKLEGRLVTLSTPGADPDDVAPEVQARVERSATARALVRANELFSAGKIGDADRELGRQLERLALQQRQWRARGVEPAAAVRTDLYDQIQLLRDAREQYRAAAASQPPAVAARSAPARANARLRAMQAYDMAL